MQDERPQATVRCRHCRHFRNDAAYLERSFPGLTGLSSGYGSTRSDDGICVRHDRYLGADAACAEFSPRDFASGHGTASGQNELHNVHAGQLR